MNRREIVLPEGYYHTHFLELLRTVQGRYCDLFSENEKSFTQSYLALPDAAQKLYVRLVNRVGPWFVVAKLRYAEIGDCAQATKTLEEAGFVDNPGSLSQRGEGCSAEEALALLTLKELASTFPAQRKAAGAKAGREDVLSAILDSVATQDIVARSIAATGGFVRPCHAQTVRLFTFLYFGNALQGATDFVLSDLGLMRYETYALDASTRAFETRVSLMQAFAAQELFDTLYVSLEANRDVWSQEQLLGARTSALALWHEVSKTLPEGPNARASRRTLRRLSKALNLLGNRLERLGCTEEALACYQEEGLPPARERKTRLLEKLNRKDDAERLAENTLQTSLDEAELAFAFRFLVKNCKRPLESLAVPADERPLLEAYLTTKHSADVWPQRSLVLPRKLRALGVEQAALCALTEEGGEGIHGENLPWCALFGLVFWEAIFAAVPGAFHHAYQLGPNDGHSPSFLTARQELCDKTLSEFETGALELKTLRERWHAKQGISNRWIAWPALTWNSMEALLTRCSRRSLARVLARMLRHPGRFDSGFPDLLLMRDNGISFWEVKGPGDELRPHQKSWLATMHAAGLQVGVVVVAFEGDTVPEPSPK